MTIASINRSRKKEIMKNVRMIVRIAIGIFICLPVILAVLYSLWPNDEIGQGAQISLIPTHFTIENYVYVLNNTPVWTYLKNTLVMLAICIPARVLFGAMAAYGFAFFKFKGSKFLFSLFLASMMIPGEVVIITHYEMIQEWDMVDTYLGLTITSLVDISCMFMLRQYMLSIPRSLYEAAKLDGCGDVRFFFRIVFPLCKTIIVAQILTSFITVYNSYFWPLLVTSSDEMRTVQTGIANLMRDSARNVGSVLAGSVLSMIIPVVVYVAGTKQITEGMSAGAVKG